MTYIKIIFLTILAPLISLFSRTEKTSSGIKEYDEEGNRVELVDRCPISYKNGKVLPVLRIKITSTPTKNKFSTYKPDAESMLRWVSKK